jgi:predicted transcriptional regulator
MIPEYQSSITIRVPDEVRVKLEDLSRKTRKSLSTVVRLIIAEGLKRKKAAERNSSRE